LTEPIEAEHSALWNRIGATQCR